MSNSVCDCKFGRSTSMGSGRGRPGLGAFRRLARRDVRSKGDCRADAQRVTLDNEGDGEPNFSVPPRVPFHFLLRPSPL